MRQVGNLLSEAHSTDGCSEWFLKLGYSVLNDELLELVIASIPLKTLFLMNG